MNVLFLAKLVAITERKQLIFMVYQVNMYVYIEIAQLHQIPPI